MLQGEGVIEKQKDNAQSNLELEVTGIFFFFFFFLNFIYLGGTAHVE